MSDRQWKGQHRNCGESSMMVLSELTATVVGYLYGLFKAIFKVDDGSSVRCILCHV